MSNRLIVNVNIIYLSEPDEILLFSECQEVVESESETIMNDIIPILQ